jgi:hypothetical protein
MPDIVLTGTSPIVQRIIRRAWLYGNTTWLWRMFFDNIFHQFSKAIVIAVLEDLQNKDGITLDLDTVSELPKIPNDPEVLI